MNVITDNEALLCLSYNLRALLKKTGTSQSDLARMTGETPMRISYYCRGVVMPGVGVAARIAEALSVKTDDLLTHPRVNAKAAV